jgi:hypothetical protein
MRNLTFLLLCLGLLVGCIRKPKACIIEQAQVETKREFTLKSCSEKYEFLTWSLSDGSTGKVGDSISHLFYNQGNFKVTLTAYGRGGFQSDGIETEIRSSYRYVDRVEVFGDIEYNVLQFKFGNYKKNKGESLGTFVESDPFTFEIMEDTNLIINQASTPIELNGIANNITYAQLQRDINFEFNVENPVVLSDTNITMKVFWKYLNE